MKAIHNQKLKRLSPRPAVSKEQIYEKWKQFTTDTYLVLWPSSCFQRANLRKMKAIHNWQNNYGNTTNAVSKEQIYEKWKQFTTSESQTFKIQTLFPKSKFTKNESNSQLISVCTIDPVGCSQRANLRKMKAIHNNGCTGWTSYLAVSKEQIYEKWKQFTTSGKDMEGDQVV